MCIELALLKITFSDVSGDASKLDLMVVYANCCQLSTPRSLLFEKVISKQVLHSLRIVDANSPICSSSISWCLREKHQFRGIRFFYDPNFMNYSQLDLWICYAFKLKAESAGQRGRGALTSPLARKPEWSLAGRRLPKFYLVSFWIDDPGKLPVLGIVDLLKNVAAFLA